MKKWIYGIILIICLCVGGFCAYQAWLIYNEDNEVDRNEKEMNELYEVLGLIARREEVQIEDRYDHVDILVCPQGKIVVTEEDGDMVLRANTRHAGPGFHAFVVDIFKDI